MNIWLAVAVGIFIGACVMGIIALLIIGGWYIGDLREDRSSGDERPYYFMEIAKGAGKRMMTSHFVILRVKREDYLAQKTRPIMDGSPK